MVVSLSAKFRIGCSIDVWRGPMEDATRLGLIELSYPADKLVNFRCCGAVDSSWFDKGIKSCWILLIM